MILVGRDKISVNMSRFHRFELKRNNDTRRDVRGVVGGDRGRGEKMGEDTRDRLEMIYSQNTFIRERRVPMLMR
jgi:hypothetical protein